MRKRSITILLIVLLSIFLMTGCESISNKDKGPVKVGLLLTTSPDDIYSEGYYGYNALKALENKYGVEITYNENVSSENNAGYLLNSYGKNEYDLVIGIGKIFEKPMLDVSVSYEGTKFVCIGGSNSEGNVTSYSLPVDDIGYLAGIISAGVNKNSYNAIAYVQDSNGIEYYDSFLKGVNAVSSQTPVKKFLFEDNMTYDGLLNKLKGNSIGAAGLMFFSESMEKHFKYSKYDFATLGGSADETEVPRIIIDYSKILDRVYSDFSDGLLKGKNLEITKSDDIMKINGIELLSYGAKIKAEAVLAVRK